MKLTRAIINEMVNEEIKSFLTKKQSIFESAVFESEFDEGGNAFETVDKIKGVDAKQIINDIIQEFQEKFPDVEIKASGSSSRIASDDEEVGDIDFIIGTPLKDEEGIAPKAQEIIDWVQQNFNETKLIPSLNVLCFSESYTTSDGEQKEAQCDFAFTKNFAFTSSLKSGLHKSETQFKNLVKNVMLKIITKLTPVGSEDYKEDLYTADDFDGKIDPSYIGKVKNKWQYTLGDDGLLFVHRTSAGKRGPRNKGGELDFTFSGAKLEERPISEDFMESMKMVLGKDVTFEDTLSPERLIAYLFSGKYEFATPERLEQIKEKTIDRLKRNYNAPEEEVNAAIAKFEEIWDSYSHGSLSEARIIGFKMTDLLRRMK